MNRVVSLAVASAIALSTLAAGVASASADWHPRHKPYYQWQPHYRPAPPPGDAGVGLAAGLLFGFAAGAIIASPPPPPYAYAPAPPPPYGVSWTEHVQWCRAVYPAYNINTDTYLDVSGYVHPCVGPY